MQGIPEVRLVHDLPQRSEVVGEPRVAIGTPFERLGAPHGSAEEGRHLLAHGGCQVLGLVHQTSVLDRSVQDAVDAHGQIV